jgi:hypothetical protein
VGKSTVSPSPANIPSGFRQREVRKLTPGSLPLANEVLVGFAKTYTSYQASGSSGTGSTVAVAPGMGCAQSESRASA